MLLLKLFLCASLLFVATAYLVGYLIWLNNFFFFSMRHILVSYHIQFRHFGFSSLVLPKIIIYLSRYMLLVID